MHSVGTRGSCVLTHLDRSFRRVRAPGARSNLPPARPEHHLAGAKGSFQHHGDGSEPRLLREQTLGGRGNERHVGVIRAADGDRCRRSCERRSCQSTVLMTSSTLSRSATTRPIAILRCLAAANREGTSAVLAATLPLAVLVIVSTSFFGFAMSAVLSAKRFYFPSAGIRTYAHCDGPF